MHENLKLLMKKNNINQSDLAKIAGVSQPFASNMIRGYKTASVAVYQRIAKHFGVSIEDVL